MAEISLPNETRSKIEELLGRANWRYCRVPPLPTEDLEAEAESLAAPYAYNGESALLQVGYEKEEPLNAPHRWGRRGTRYDSLGDITFPTFTPLAPISDPDHSDSWETE